MSDFHARMRDAADVMDAVNAFSMRFLADRWEEQDAANG